MHFSCPAANGTERWCFSRVKLLETLGATTDDYLRDTACGLLRRGGTRAVEVVCAGGAGGQNVGCQGCEPGWGPAGRAGNLCSCCPEVSFPLGAGIASRRQCLVPRLEVWEMLLDPRALRDSACSWLCVTEFDDPGDAFCSCVPACTSAALIFFQRSKGFLLFYLDWGLTRFLAAKSFPQLGTSKWKSVL